MEIDWIWGAADHGRDGWELVSDQVMGGVSAWNGAFTVCHAPVVSNEARKDCQGRSSAVVLRWRL